MEIDGFLNEKTALKYIKEETDILSDSGKIRVEIMDSNSLSFDGLANNLLVIGDENSPKRFILKQMLPYVRAAIQESDLKISLPEGRIYSEYCSLKLFKGICPDYVADAYFLDAENNIIIFEYIEDMELLRSEFIRQKRHEHLAQQIAVFLARIHFFTSDLFLDRDIVKALQDFFAKSDSIKSWDKFIFTGSILEAEDKKMNPYLDAKISEFRNDNLVRKKTKEIRDIFMNKRESLTHGDFHTSNIFINKDKIMIFDTEYSNYTPSAFDLGRLLANVILNYASLISKDYSLDSKNYQNYLLSLIEDIYNNYQKEYTKLLKKHCDYEQDYLADYFANYLFELISFIACTIITRIYDGGLCLDFMLIKDLKKRALGQEFIIELAHKLLEKNKDFRSIEEFTEFVSNYAVEFQLSKVIKNTLAEIN